MTEGSESDDGDSNVNVNATISNEPSLGADAKIRIEVRG